MKIIDLLNKIANDEKVPRKFTYKGYLWEYDVKNKMWFYYFGESKSHRFDRLFYLNMILTDEVEILEEEKKIPEKLEDISEIKCVGCKVEINIAGNKTLFDTDTPIVTEHCIYKINQLIKNQKKIIDYLKSKGE